MNIEFKGFKLFGLVITTKKRFLDTLKVKITEDELCELIKMNLDKIN